MPLPAPFDRLRLPVIGSPLFIVSGPELVIAQCKAGIVGSFPALNARPQSQVDEWLHQITEELAAHNRDNPDRPAAPFAVNQIVHKSNDRLDADMATCAKWQVPMVITSLGAREEVFSAVKGWGGITLHDVINDRFARKAIEKGATGLIPVAAGAGGHAGVLSPFALMQEIREWFDGLVALSGSIAHGRSILGAQALGADFAYIGSPWIAATEANADEGYKQAIVDGFAELVDTIEPPILKFVTNPLTGERSYHGKDMPIVSWDMISGVDYIDVTCAPKALGAGRWAALEIFSYPTLDEIEAWIMDMVVRAGSQHCPPVTIGIGIGGSFDHAARLAKQQTLRPFGTTNPEPILADMEKRLLEAVNSTGFGPMGTGGVTTAFGVHIDYASGHGFTPVAIAFNCWINRRTRAKIYNSGEVERIE